MRDSLPVQRRRHVLAVAGVQGRQRRRAGGGGLNRRALQDHVGHGRFTALLRGDPRFRRTFRLRNAWAMLAAGGGRFALGSRTASFGLAASSSLGFRRRRSAAGFAAGAVRRRRARAARTRATRARAARARRLRAGTVGGASPAAGKGERGYREHQEDPGARGLRGLHQETLIDSPRCNSNASVGNLPFHSTDSPSASSPVPVALKLDGPNVALSLALSIRPPAVPVT